MALGLFWDVMTGLPWTPNGVGSLEPRGYCIFLPGAHYLMINSPDGADSPLNKLLLILLHLFEWAKKSCRVWIGVQNFGVHHSAVARNLGLGCFKMCWGAWIMIPTSFYLRIWIPAPMDYPTIFSSLRYLTLLPCSTPFLPILFPILYLTLLPRSTPFLPILFPILYLTLLPRSTPFLPILFPILYLTLLPRSTPFLPILFPILYLTLLPRSTPFLPILFPNFPVCKFLVSL